MAENRKKTLRRIGVVLLIVAILAVGAWAASRIIALQVDDNTFTTGVIDINLNDGLPVITPEEYLFEPGMTVVKPLFIENVGTGDVWYRLYFTEVSGYLADVLDITILDGEGNELLTGKMNDLTGRLSMKDAAYLAVGERQDLTMQFYYPWPEGNEGQSTDLEFQVSAVAVQAKNNPDAEF